MERAEIDAEFTAANPWWRDPSGWESSDVQLRAVESSRLTYNPRPLDDLRSGGLYILRGPRRVGKSTALKQLVSERLRSSTPPRTILHISVEGRSATDVTDIIRRGADAFLTGEPGDRLWLLDEITGVQGEWPAAIKRLRDQHISFSSDTVVLTGSSAAKFDKARKWLGGRRETPGSNRILFQMSFGDFLEALGVGVPDSPELRPADLGDPDRCEKAVSDLRPWISDLVEGWDTYLRVGGYPQAVAAELAHNADHQAVLDEALWDIIQGDAFEDAGLTHTQTQTILRRLATSLTSLLSVRSLADKINVSPTTAAKRLDALRRSFIAFPVHREQGLAPKPSSQSKWYFTDPALTRLASSRGVGQPPDSTALSEQQVALALLRASERQESGAAFKHDRLLYYRSSTNAEIDFVSSDFPNTCVESKFVDTGWGRAFQTIGASNFAPGVVATRSGVNRHDDGWALPAGLVVYLLGL
jgi:predicted AAA+ superfamily ATPase